MRRVLPTILAALLLVISPALQAETTDAGGTNNARQARAALDAMVAALGGDAWLSVKNQVRQGYITSFSHDYSIGNAVPYWEFHAWPDQDRIEFSKHRDMVRIYLGRTGTELTFKGALALPKEQLEDYLRCRDHSIETVIKSWLKDSRTILVYEGQREGGQRTVEQVTAISAQNEAVTIQIDTVTHLPFSRSFEWCDSAYKDKILDAEEYDNYRTIDGLSTPFTITRFKNNEVVKQYALTRVSYNQTLPADLWSIDATERRIVK